MAKYSVRFVHKISNPDGYTPGDDVELPPGAFSDSKTLARHLREEKVLLSGARVSEFRVEADRVVVFPRLPSFSTYWHSVILRLKPDFLVSGGGSVYLLHPESDEAKEWAGEHLPEDGLRMGDAYAVEHRYLGDLVDGIQGDGLTVGQA